MLDLHPSSFRPGEFVRIAGSPVSYRIEQNTDERQIDHLITVVRTDTAGTAEIVLNTFSVRSVDAGFDGRIRLGVIRSTWHALPPAGISRSGGIDYALVEKNNQMVYRELEQPKLESLLIEKIQHARFIEGWGEFYKRGRPGIHQIHSRSASCAVSTAHMERDGAIRFYFEPDRLADLLLFKFCGQP